MAQFATYIPLLLQVEGGFQKNPNDQGNYNSLGQLIGTNRGISARFYEGIIKRPPSLNDIMTISKTKAQNLYRTHFWNKLNADNINNQNVANTIVDHHVNAGRGAQLAQKVLNQKFFKNVAVDNAMGPQTLSAINSVDPATFTARYNEAREDYYRSLGNSSTFLNGWLYRLKKFAFDINAATNSPTAKKAGLGITIITLGVFGWYVFKKD